MKVADFNQLIAGAGLVLLSNWPPRFLVCLCVEKEMSLEDGGIVRSIRFQCETMVYQPAEFAMLEPDRAKQQIAAMKRSLERAAHTQQGRTSDERAPQKQPAQKIIRQPSAIKYPAH